MAAATKTNIQVVIKFLSEKSFCSPYMVKLKAFFYARIYFVFIGVISGGSSRMSDLATTLHS
jgi:hypothetical protein